MLAGRLGYRRFGSVPTHAWRSAGIAALATAWIGLSGTARGQCPEWSPDFAVPGPDKAVEAIVEHDDGSGPALYLGGRFITVPGVSVPVDRIARWDGTEWSPVGSGFDGSVLALAVFDDGTGPKLYAGGEFSSAGGVPVAGIARWDGVAWSALDSGLDGPVEALAVFDDGSGPALHAGGEFTSASVVAASGIAKWDGTDWHALGSGVSGTGAGAGVNGLEVWDDGSGPALYAVGKFSVAGGVAANHIGRWDGSGWTPVGTGFGKEAKAIAVHSDASGSALYVGGTFLQAGGGPAAHIAKWDGTNWSALGAGLDADVAALVSHGGLLYAGGLFANAGGQPASRIASWEGLAWSALGAGISAAVFSLASHDDGSGAGPALYAGGNVKSAGGTTASGVARWNGTWSQVGPGGMGVSERIHAFEIYDDGNGPALYATGSFLKAGGIQANLIARWDGTSWSPLGSGLGLGTGLFEDGLALTVWDDGTGPVLAAGGRFSQAGGYPANSIARWNGVDWRPLGSGVSGTVNDLAVWDDGAGPALHAAGNFTVASGISARRIAKWDGSSWVPLGTGLDDEVMALAVHSDASGSALYVGGEFLQAGGLPAAHVAKWDGTSWSALGAGLDGDVDALVSHAGALYAGGGFTTAGGTPASRIARWDGTTWSTLGAGLNSTPLALSSYDDGAGQGPGLYAAGLFSLAGGSPASRLARWDGASWAPVAGGLDAAAFAMAEFQEGAGWPALYVGGDFGKAGIESALRIASLVNECACQGTPYCMAGTTASGCHAVMTSAGAASASAGVGFDVSVVDVEGSKSGAIFFSTNGAQAQPWGNGTSFLCVAPPLVHTGTLAGAGTNGACDGSFQLDFNAWMAAHPAKAPSAGDSAYLQCWFRDPLSTSNQTSSLSNALRASVCP